MCMSLLKIELILEKKFVKNFWAPSVMLKADIQIKLLKIDVTDKNLYKPGENIDIGMGTKLNVSTYKTSLKFKESALKSFLDCIHRTLSGLVEYMPEKSSLTQFFNTFSWCNKSQHHCN